MKEQSRSRGRGRAKIVSPKINTPKHSLGHGKACVNTAPSEAVDISSMYKVSSCKSPESAPAGTPIQEVLADANKRFENYGHLKHNPATQKPHQPDLETEAFPALPTSNIHSGANKAVAAKKSSKSRFSKSAWEISSTDLTSETRNRQTYSECKSKGTETPTCDDFAANQLPDKTVDDDSIVKEVDRLWNSMGYKSGGEELTVDSLTELQHSTPHPNRGYAVRIECLPSGTTQSQLEEVISPYGQLLDLKLELRISEGKEKLSADFIVADESVAEFVVMCLDGAETIFEGPHAPVSCFRK